MARSGMLNFITFSSLDLILIYIQYKNNFLYRSVCQVPFKMYLEAILAQVKLLEAEDGLCLPTSGSVLVCASLHRSEVQSVNKV
jgi:hypothetical protein